MRQVFAFISDIHSPFEDWRCLALAAKRIEYLRPSLLVYGGDLLDCYLEGKFVRVGSTISKFTQEIESVKAVLDYFHKAAPRATKIMLEGNHERRHKVAIAMMGNVPGYLEGYPGLNLEDALELKKRGITYVHSKSGNAHAKIGPLLFSHGDRYGANPAAAELRDNLCSGVSGHVHRMTEARMTSKISGVDIKWLTSGTLAKAAHYRDKNNEHLGFVTGWLDEDTNQFHLQHETIHADGDYGTATLYAAEGTYTAYPTNNGGVTVRCDTNKAKQSTKHR